MMGGTSATRALGTLLVLAAYGCFAPRENLLEGFEEVEPQEVPWALISGWLVIQAPSRDGVHHALRWRGQRGQASRVGAPPP